MFFDETLFYATQMARFVGIAPTSDALQASANLSQLKTECDAYFVYK